MKYHKKILIYSFSTIQESLKKKSTRMFCVVKMYEYRKKIPEKIISFFWGDDFFRYFYMSDIPGGWSMYLANSYVHLKKSGYFSGFFFPFLDLDLENLDFFMQ